MNAQDVHDLARQDAHPELAEIKRTVLREERVDVLIERRVIDVAARHAEREHGRLHLKRIMIRECDDSLADGRAVAIRKATHHAEVEPDDATIPHPDVAGVRVGMEEAVVDNLLDVILAEPLPKHGHIDAARAQAVEIINRHTVDVFHDEDVLRRELPIDVWARHEHVIVIEVRELFDVVGLDEEVHLLLRNRPHLVEHHVEVDDVLRMAHDFDEARRTLQEHHVARHDLIDAGALDFHDDVLARDEHGAVHLRDGGRAEHGLFDALEDLVPLAAVLLLNRLDDRLKRHRLRRTLELDELVAVFLRQEVWAHAHDLAELYERRAEVFEDVAQLLRREPAYDVVLPEDVHHFAQPDGRAEFFLLFSLQTRKKLAEHAIPPSCSGVRRLLLRPCTSRQSAAARSRSRGTRHTSSRGRRRRPA